MMVIMDDVVIGGDTISTTHVPDAEAFDMWSSIMSDGMVPLSMDPGGDGPFHGALTPVITSDSLTIALAENSPQVANRTAQHIAMTSGDWVVASLALDGGNLLTWGDEQIRAPAGTMFIVDGRVPQQARTGNYRGLVIRAPRDLVVDAAGLGEDELPGLVVLEPGGHGGLVIDYFRRLVTLPHLALRTPALLQAGIDLLGAGLALSGGNRPDESATTLDRERVVDFVTRHLADPGLDAETIARACRLSRRKLYRVLDDPWGGPMTMLRRMRVQRGCELLASAPDKTIAAVARACGFNSDRHFYRVFRAETGCTPAEFRERVIITDRIRPGAPRG